jgi:hypothetical protein
MGKKGARLIARFWLQVLESVKESLSQCPILGSGHRIGNRELVSLPDFGFKATKR